MKTKKLIYGVIFISLLFTLVGCNLNIEEQNTENLLNNINGSQTNLSTVTVFSKTNLADWEITPKLYYNNGVRVVNVKVYYKGMKAESISASIANAQFNIEELENGQYFEVGSSVYDNTKITFYLSWEEKGKHQEGHADLIIKE